MPHPQGQPLCTTHRSAGVRLGYINQLYVDPARLQVVGVYLRDTLLSVPGVAYDVDHFGLRNMLQVGDVVLVHDERVRRLLWGVVFVCIRLCAGRNVLQVAGVEVVHGEKVCTRLWGYVFMCVFVCAALQAAENGRRCAHARPGGGHARAAPPSPTPTSAPRTTGSARPALQ